MSSSSTSADEIKEAKAEARAYLAALPPHPRRELRKVNALIRAAVPGATDQLGQLPEPVERVIFSACPRRASTEASVPTRALRYPPTQLPADSSRSIGLPSHVRLLPRRGGTHRHSTRHRRRMSSQPSRSWYRQAARRRVRVRGQTGPRSA